MEKLAARERGRAVLSSVLSSLLAVYLLFVLLYGLTGSVVHEASPGGVDAPYVTRDPRDLAIFSLATITTVETHTVGLLPRAEWVLLLKGAETFLGIFLTGLLGFVTGNKIRR
jgi:hypothetical protein